jgi:hypothetical protein
MFRFASFLLFTASITQKSIAKPKHKPGTKNTVQ